MLLFIPKQGSCFFELTFGEGVQPLKLLDLASELVLHLPIESTTITGQLNRPRAAAALTESMEVGKTPAIVTLCGLGCITSLRGPGSGAPVELSAAPREAVTRTHFKTLRKVIIKQAI